jgi:uncharacterized membrane protein
MLEMWRARGGGLSGGVTAVVTEVYRAIVLIQASREVKEDADRRKGNVSLSAISRTFNSLSRVLCNFR